MLHSRHHTFIFDRRCHFLSQILVICGKFEFYAFIWRKLRLRLIECFHVLTVRLLLVKEHVGGFNASRAAILMSRTVMVVERNSFWKFRIGGRTCWRLMPNARRIERDFNIALWPATKNGSTMIIPSTENHGECPDIPPHRRPDQIFTVTRLCCAFSGTSSVWCQDILGNAEMGGLSPPAVLSRRCSFWLPFVSMDGTRPGSSAFPLLWRSQKMDRFMDCLKRRIVFPRCYPTIARKITFYE